MMTVRDVVNRIRFMEESLERVENARRAGFDLDVTVGQIDETRREIERLYCLEIGGVNEKLEAMRACDELRGMVEDIVRGAYVRVFGGDRDA